MTDLEIIQYREKGYFKEVYKNLTNYFKSKSSQGCLMVEKENGPDKYIENLRQDIFDRFRKLREVM